jgi:hypothetical protein
VSEQGQGDDNIGRIRKKKARGWRKLYSEEVHNLQFSPRYN